MEYAKDEVFEISYHTTLNRLERKEEKWISKFCRRVKSHKLLTMIVFVFLMFATVNTVMLYSFMKILQNV